MKWTRDPKMSQGLKLNVIIKKELTIECQFPCIV
ncbi:hypothetical protein BMQ_pBM70011 (plasmid) [Priestia megaterium QM B1551]|uniref:Uncharacterized protein n=1 Tax=Priestia megaterium (strain ATCC 12872 / QMB1551) TaxID=545693 RepID=D5E428_PRIM1|nr:hypothetical protein BMQ_pBM70011 [Priestia megaterium QM B1551]